MCYPCDRGIVLPICPGYTGRFPRDESRGYDCFGWPAPAPHVGVRSDKRLTIAVTPFAQNLLTVRLQLEPLAVGLAAAGADADDLDELEGQFEIMRRSARDRDYPKFYEADIRFHTVLAESTHNDFLVASMRPLSIAPIAFILAGLHTIQEVEYERVAEEHQAVLETIRKGDAAEAAAAMRAQIEAWHAFQLSEAPRLERAK